MVTTVEKAIEAKALLPNTLAQKTEVIALTRALELAKGKKINMWTDSKYAFSVVHAHGAIYKGRCLLSAQGKSIKHIQEMPRLLEAVQQPEKVAIMHCCSHQRGNNAEEMGNALADREVKRATENAVTEGSLIPDSKIQVDSEPKYSKGDCNLINDLGEQKREGWAFTPQRKVIILSATLWAILKAKHRKTHWSTEALYKSLMGRYRQKFIYHNEIDDSAI